MFVQCRRSVSIIDYKEGKRFNMPSEYIGDVPKWVEGNKYFKALCADGTITAYVNKVTSDKAFESSDKEAKALKARKDEIAKKQRELDAKINAAKEKAIKEAREKGLDEISTENYVKEQIEKIKE